MYSKYLFFIEDRFLYSPYQSPWPEHPSSKYYAQSTNISSYVLPFTLSFFSQHYRHLLRYLPAYRDCNN